MENPSPITCLIWSVRRAEQCVVQEGSSPSGAQMRGAISKNGGNSSLAEEVEWVVRRAETGNRATPNRTEAAKRKGTCQEDCVWQGAVLSYEFNNSELGVCETGKSIEPRWPVGAVELRAKAA